VDPRAYREGTLDSINSLNPLDAESDTEKAISRLAYRSLFRYDKSGNIVPDLVSSYEISEDAMSYIINIRNDAFFANGDNISASDIIYSSSRTNSLREIGIDKLDEFTVKYTLPNKYSPFLSVLTFPVISEKKHFSESGDFRITKIKRGKSGIEEVSLYTTKANYSFKRITFRKYQSSDDLKNAFKLGDIDGFVSSEMFSWVGLNTYKIVLNGRYFVAHFNMLKEPFSKKENRVFALKSINLDEFFIVSKIDPDQKINGPISNSPYTKTNLAKVEYNPNIKQDANLVSIKLYVPNSEAVSQQIQLIDTFLKKAGFNPEIKKLSESDIKYAITTKRDYDIIILGEEVGRDPDRYVFWHSTQKDPPGLNLSGLSNLRVDKALEKGRDEIDFIKRKEHYDIFQTAVTEEAPALFLYHLNTIFYLRDNILPGNFEDLYYPYDRFNSFYTWGL
jgi:peptide/nickel transport system substrate-binding protein